ncbi:MAG: ribonuclease HIII [Lentisphaeria bacterium]|nr:ribonuclease HIII [Lentisphaeria bacterium]
MSAVRVITQQQSDALRSILEEKNWTFSDLPYARWKAVGDKVNAVSYDSGKLVVQGAKAAEFIEFILEPLIGVELPAETIPENNSPHCGVDESGKGDFFGPLIIAGVYVNEFTAPKLRALGVCDSKMIKSDKKICELAQKIREIVGTAYTVVTLPPATYNRLYSQIGNLNRLLAWGHARCIENILEKVPECPHALSDKFGDESLIKRALMEKGRKIRLEQRTKAESDIAVAAASILAREGFVNGCAKLSERFGMEFTKGAGPKVIENGRLLLAHYGAEAFTECAKLHFKTYQELLNEGELL